jgi:4-aminobutyrate aminotransferase
MRTGKYFSVEHIPDFKPDALIMAKGLANGFPLSGLVTRKELSDKLEPGSFGGTYAGNAVACAAGIAAQEVFQTEDIAGNVAARSAQLYDALNKLATSPKTKHLIAEVRGQGLMAAIEFRMASDPLTHTGVEGTTIPADIGKRVQKYCMDQNLLILTTSCFDTIRFIPALVVSEEEMNKAIGIFSDAVEKVALEG